MKFSIELSEYSAKTRKLMAKETKDSDFLDILVEDEDIEVVYEAIRNPYIKIATVEKLSESKNVDIICETAKKTKISRGTIERLSNDKNSRVRWCVAVTPYEEEHRDILIKLAKDSDRDVRHGVVLYGLSARGISHDEEILAMLIDDSWEIIRSSVAALTRDPEKLDKLSRDKEWVVRAAVIMNKATKRETIEAMEDDPNYNCRKYVYQYLTFGKVLDEGDW